MKVSRGRIQKAELAYSQLVKKPVCITTDRTAWKVIDLKSKTCIAKYPSFFDIETFIRNPKIKKDSSKSDRNRFKRKNQKKKS